MNKQEYIQSLRGLADFLEEKSLPDEWISNLWSETKETYSSPLHEFRVIDKKVFGEIVTILGAFDKSTTDYNVRAITTLPYGAQVIVAITREQMCKKIVVGKKKIPFEQAHLIEAIPEHDEDIVEWKCPDSFVALKGESNDGSK